MKRIKQIVVYLLSGCALLSGGCKKSEQIVKMGQVPAPDCEPISVFSTPINETYIVMLRDDGNQSGTIQTLGKSTTAISTIFNRHSIPENQRVAILNYIHSGFVARLDRNQAEALSRTRMWNWWSRTG